MHLIFWEYWVARMGKQILLCVETNKQARTDYKYIVETIKRFYVLNPKIIHRPIFLESKTKYKANDKVKEINKYINDYKKFGNTTVIYFIDTDDYDVSSETKLLYDNIQSYCSDNKYELVYFSKDVEDVFWGFQVDNSKKVDKADEFTRKKVIETVLVDKLQSNKMKRHNSNILLVLDKYWNRKKTR